MIQLDVLSGKKAGTSVVARRFPFQVGRAADSGLCLDDAGVWDRHVTFAVRKREGVALTVQQDALATINHEPARTELLKNGDVIEFGAVKLRFTLSAARQRSQRWREIFTWFALAILSLGQVVLIYWFLD